MALKETAKADGDNDACQNTANGRQDRTENSGDLQADKGGSVDRQGTRRHLGYGDDIGKGLFGDPAMKLYYLLLNQRYDGIAASDAEQPNLKKDKK